MGYPPTAPPEEVKLNPFDIFSEGDVKDILHIITDGKCKIPATSNVTKVQLPQGNRKPIDINVCNKIILEPSKRIKILIQVNALLWLLTVSIFSISLGYMYLKLQTQERNIQELSQTLLSISSKYEFLSDSVSRTLSATDFTPPQSKDSEKRVNVFNHDQKDKNVHPGDSAPAVDVEKYNENDEYDEYGNDDDAKINNEGVISYRRNRQRNTKVPAGPVVIQFRGALPHVDIANEGRLIGPWVTDEVGSGIYNLTEFYITEQGYAIEIVQSGLYIIYAQVYYETSSLSNSFAVNIRKKGSDNTSPIAHCSTITQNSVGYKLHESSCYTSVVRYLSQHDRIVLQQQEINRRVIMRDGFSFIGLVRLNSELNTLDRNPKRRT